MPLFNRRGDVLMGIGDGPGSVNGQEFARPGGGGAWLDDEFLIAQVREADGYKLAMFDRTGRQTSVKVHRGANVVHAGGGRWVAWASDHGMFGALNDPKAYPQAVGPDGTLAVTRDYQSGRGFVLVPPDETLATPGLVEVLHDVAYDVQVLSPTGAIYCNAARQVVGLNVPAPSTVGKVYRPRRVMFHGEPWIVYWSEPHGLVAHRWSDPSRAVVIEPEPVAFNHDAVVTDVDNGQFLYVAYSARGGEHPEDLRTVALEVSDAVTDLRAPAAVPTFAPFTKPLWAGYFYATSDRYGDNPTAPGNCEVVVEPGVVRRTRRPVIVSREALDPTPTAFDRTIAIWRSGLTLDELNTPFPAMTRPVIHYLDKPVWPGPLRLPGIAGVQVYCGVLETLTQFRARARTQMDACGARRIALICQAYDTNDSQTTDLAPLQAIYYELAQDPRVEFVLWFSDGRALPDGSRGGTRVHPELRPWHEALVRAIPATPRIGDTVIPPKVTISRYGPTEGTQTLRTQAIALREADSGPVDRYRWLYRKVGASLWIQAADNSANDIDHTYEFGPGVWEIALQGVGPGGTHQTGRQRLVTVHAEPVPGPDPVPDPIPDPVPDPVPVPEPVPVPTPRPSGTRVTFQSDPPDGRYLCAEEEGKKALVFRRSVPGPEPGAWETFELERLGNNQIALKAVNGKYVAAESGGGKHLIANRASRGPWETLTVVDGRALRADNGQFVAVRDGLVRADSWDPVLWTPSVDLTVAAPVTPVGELADVPILPTGRIFTRGGPAWRWKGVTAFQLLDRFAKGEDLTPFFRAFAGFNLLRIFPYVPVADWRDKAWDVPPNAVTSDFLLMCIQAGFYVELTLLTDDDPGRLPWARSLVEHLASVRPPNLLLEAGNEPQIHKHIDTQALKDVLSRSGFPHTSGEYHDMTQHYGTYITSHTERDSEWPRRAHDLFDYYETDGGPHLPGPRLKIPAVADEPIRPDQAGFNIEDFRAYFGTCAILGAGATFHYENGKYGLPPTAQEAACAQAALEGLDAFPAGAPVGPYRRPVENSLRTYIVGSSMVRVRPTSAHPPEPGWRPLDGSGILWTR